jgi:hypothetical protein
MKLSTSFVFAVIPAAMGAAPRCIPNKCAKAITDTQTALPIETRLAECSSFMTATVYATATETVTSYGAPGQFVKRAPKTNSVPAWASGCNNNAAFSSACDCAGVTAGTATVTAATATITTTVSPTCSRGLQYAFYKATEGTGPGQIPFNPADGFYTEINSKVDEIKTWAPQATGVTHVIGGIRSADWPDGALPPVVYDYTGPASMDSQYIAIDHRGYLYAEQAGTYTITFLSSNEVTFAWVGSRVDSQIWTYPQVSVSQTFAAGQFVPLRFLYVNAQGGASMFLNITAPDGTIILSQDSPASDYIIQGCDGGPAVPYAPWGTIW